MALHRGIDLFDILPVADHQKHDAVLFVVFSIRPGITIVNKSAGSDHDKYAALSRENLLHQPLVIF